MPNDVTTITIKVGETGIELEPSESEGNHAVGRKHGRVQWQGGDGVGTWVVALKDGVVTPFLHDRRAFTESSSGTDGEQITGNPSDGDHIHYSVFVQKIGTNDALFLDPIIVIRNSTRSSQARIADLTEILATDVRKLATQAEDVAKEARLTDGQI